MSGQPCARCGKQLTSSNYIDYHCECGASFLRRGGELVEQRPDPKPSEPVTSTAVETPGPCARCKVASPDGFLFTCIVCDAVFWRRGGELIPQGKTEPLPGDDPLPRAIVVDRDRD